jgi:porin
MVFPTTTPYVTAFGSGILFKASENLVFTAMFMDKQESSLDDNLGSLGDEGWNTMFGAAGTYELFGLPGGSSLAGAYAWDGDFTTIGEGQLNPIPPDPDLGSQSTSWAIAGTHWQYLWVFEDDVPAASTLNLRDGRPDLRGWGAFFMWGYADEDSNPFQWTLAGGIAGKGIVPGRPNDVLGLGYFYAELAEGGVIDRQIGVRDGEQGFEIYYEAQVTPWLHLTPDLQVVRPGFASNDTAVILGLRAVVDF